VDTPHADVAAANVTAKKNRFIVGLPVRPQIQGSKWQEPFPPRPRKLKLLTLARDLRRRKAREKQRLFVAEGVRAVEALVESPLAIRGALIAPQLLDAPRGAALANLLKERTIPSEQVSAAEFASAAETDSPQGVIAIAVVPDHSFANLPADWSGVLLVLDAVQDPGNVGTIIRTASALGAVATVALPGTVDLWNAKVVRSGMGSHFTHPAFSSTWSELDTFRSRMPLALWAADASGDDAAAIAPARPARIALVVGNEGAGVSPEARSRAERSVAVPIASDVDSLNVAVAAGILLYTLTR
jgi:TrmH family RNA methyltransferase